MASLTITIPDEKVTELNTAIKGLYPIPKNEETGEPMFTDNEWAKKVVVKFLIQTHARYTQMQAQKSIQYTEDQTIAS